MPEEKKQRPKEYQKEYQKNYHNAKEIYSKEKAAEYYAQIKEAIKDKSIKNRHKKKKTILKSTEEKGIKNWFNIKKKR